MMALVAGGGKPFSLGRALMWAAGWAVGAAVGVALGGWLTLVGGASAPGVTELDPWMDLGLLPLVAFGAAFVVHVVGQLIAAMIRGRRADSGSDSDDKNPDADHDSVGRKVGSEVHPAQDPS
ncbi:MAG: hypothetical protein JXE06_01450 [Coriobacteriia bacterium]|nr:hypothetical protein [Coriobacteriia bacterium]